MDEGYQCQRCSEVFLRFRDLQAHAKAEHRQRVIVTSIENLWLEAFGGVDPAETP